MINLMLTIRLSTDELKKLDKKRKETDYAKYIESLVRQDLKHSQE